MKKKVLVFTAGVFSLFTGYSQNTNDVLNLLTQKKVISQQDADSLRADVAIKQQNADPAKATTTILSNKGLVLSGYTQVRYQNFQQPGNVDGVDIRRARLDLNANASKVWGYRLQIELAATPKILDAYAEYKPNDYIHVTVGQFKAPYSQEGLTSSNTYEFIDNSQVVGALTARGGTGVPTDVIGNQQGYDEGLQISGNFLKINDLSLIEYKAAVINGSGLNVGDNYKFKDVVGRLVLHPIKGISLGGFAYNGQGYYNNGVIVAPAKAAIVTNHERSRFGAEFSVEYFGAALRGEYISGKDGTILRNGYYVSAGYFVFPKKLQLLFRVDSYDPNTSKTKVTTTNYTPVLNYYFNTTTRLQLAYTIKNETPYVKNNVAVVQLQIGF